MNTLCHFSTNKACVGHALWGRVTLSTACNTQLFREIDMSDSKKYTVRTIEKRNGWCAEIVRQVTSRRTTVSKREMGFNSEAEAQAWGEKELDTFIRNQAERNKRKSAERQAQDPQES